MAKDVGVRFVVPQGDNDSEICVNFATHEDETKTVQVSSKTHEQLLTDCKITVIDGTAYIYIKIMSSDKTLQINQIGFYYVDIDDYYVIDIYKAQSPSEYNYNQDIWYLIPSSE